MNPLLYLLAWGLSYLPDAWFQYLCWRFIGHQFSATVLTDEGGFFVIDPSARCATCAAPMSEDVYEMVTNVYAATMQEEVA